MATKPPAAMPTIMPIVSGQPAPTSSATPAAATAPPAALESKSPNTK